MSSDSLYHRERARQCRDMAKRSTDSEVRRIHEELAALHAAQAGPKAEAGASA